MSGSLAQQIVQRLATRDTTRSEADIQADIYALLTSGELALAPDQVARLEVGTADGTRRRLDVEVGHGVFEVKRDLRSAAVRRAAQEQLTGYVVDRSRLHGRRYVGVLTDGVEWQLYDLRPAPGGGSRLVEVASLHLTGGTLDADHLLAWLEAILATESGVRPSPREIEQRLGASSPAHLLDHAGLIALYERGRTIPEVAVKRTLWARLLKTAFGAAFRDDDATFIDHSLLVLTAEIIAHAVIGLDVSALGGMAPADLVSGRAFDDAQVHGVVEADFFDWVVRIEGGEAFVRTLADRISRFDWSHVDHDVLKHLYESVIDAEARASLGEYYTPDWLADRIVHDTLTDPLSQRTLDPSCGSGTFVFHAARAYLQACDAAGRSTEEAITGLTTHVLGMDIHPVAVTLARVTYLIAIGSKRLQATDRPAFTVSIFLGDSLQWEQNRDLFSSDNTVSINTTSNELTGAGGGTLLDDDLIFPRSVLRDAARFDRLATEMADKALDISNTQDRTLIGPVLRRHQVPEEDRTQLTATFSTMRALARTGRNHIWGYYVRNLIRPIWLTEPENRVDVLVGNPPWLRYSKMTKSMQDRYKSLAEPRQLLTGGLGASGRDLSTLFVVRAIELYLKSGGSFAFVMPHGVLTRLPHTGFRSGRWSPHTSATSSLDVAFGHAWDLAKTPTGFPMVSCVVRGTYSNAHGSRMPNTTIAWSARRSSSHGAWADIQHRFSTAPGTVHAIDAASDLPVSPYKSRFRQGAILVPRVLVMVEDAPAGPLGAGAGRRRVISRRTRQEKPPWKDVASIERPVETRFVRPVHLGETVLPYRLTHPLHAVIPASDDQLMTQADIDAHSGLSAWWADAEQHWEANKAVGDDSAFLDRIDFHGQLSAQLPAPSQRVVYSASGNTLAAARVTDPKVILEHMLYWAPARSTAEARYLTGILNSQALLERVRPLQAVGLFGPRHFDKTVFYVPFPAFDETNDDHALLVELVAEAEEVAATVALSGTFQHSRQAIRAALTTHGISTRLEAAVGAILPVVETLLAAGDDTADHTTTDFTDQ